MLRRTIAIAVAVPSSARRLRLRRRRRRRRATPPTTTTRAAVEPLTHRRHQRRRHRRRGHRRPRHRAPAARRRRGRRGGARREPDRHVRQTTPAGPPPTPTARRSAGRGHCGRRVPGRHDRVALDELGVEPDLVVSGINPGQNVGPLAYLSGTVGAGRAAVRRGIPAIAGSAGLERRRRLRRGRRAHRGVHRRAPRGATRTVPPTPERSSTSTSPTAPPAPRELLEVDLATEIPEGVNVVREPTARRASRRPPTTSGRGHRLPGAQPRAAGGPAG